MIIGNETINESKKNNNITGIEILREQNFNIIDNKTSPTKNNTNFATLIKQNEVSLVFKDIKNKKTAINNPKKAKIEICNNNNFNLFSTGEINNNNENNFKICPLNNPLLNLSLSVVHESLLSLNFWQYFFSSNNLILFGSPIKLISCTLKLLLIIKKSSFSLLFLLLLIEVDDLVFFISFSKLLTLEEL